jgi:hypothetical protein
MVGHARFPRRAQAEQIVRIGGTRVNDGKPRVDRIRIVVISHEWTPYVLVDFRGGR